MIIEKARPEQLSEIFEIFAACKRSLEKENIFQWTDQYPAIHHIAGDIENGFLYSINSLGKSLGVINISEIEEPEYKSIGWSDNGGRCLVIHRLAVHPDSQKLGLARKLMDFAEHIARESAFTSIRLDAYSGNERVLRFYESRGYQKRGEVNFPGRALPFFCYEKEILG
jgi:ribosomal protein S18 acetylase RimI-like enzyme